MLVDSCGELYTQSNPQSYKVSITVKAPLIR
jgi:hypothetical protein